MIRNALIFLIFSIWGIQHSHAQSGYVFATKSTSSLNLIKKGYVKNLFAIDLKSIDADDSEDKPFTKKRKRLKKAVLPVFILSDSGSLIININFEIELVHSSKTFYFFRPIFSFSERGPPVF